MQIETPTRSSSSIHDSFSRLSDILMPTSESRLKTSPDKDHLALSPPYDPFNSPPGRYSDQRLDLTEEIFALESHLQSTPVRRKGPLSIIPSSSRSLTTAATVTEDQSPVVRHVARSFERNSASSEKQQDQETYTGTTFSSPDAVRAQESRKKRAALFTRSEAPSDNDVISGSDTVNGNEDQSFADYVDIEAAAKKRLRILFSRFKDATDARPPPPSPPAKEDPLQDLRQVLDEYGIEKARYLSTSTPPEDLLDLVYDITEALRISAQAMAHERFYRFRWKERHEEAQEQVDALTQEIREISADAVSMIQGIDEWMAEGAQQQAFRQFPQTNTAEAAMRFSAEQPPLNLDGSEQQSANLQSPLRSELDSNVPICEATLLTSQSSAQSQQRMIDQLQEDLDVAQVQIGSLQHRLQDALTCDTRDATISKLRERVKDLEQMVAMKSSSPTSHFTVHDDFGTSSAHNVLEQSSADYQAMVVPLLEQIEFLRAELHAKNDSIDSKLARLPLSEMPLQGSATRCSRSAAKDDQKLDDSELLVVQQGFQESIIKGLLREVTFLRAKQRRDALFRCDLAFQKHVLVAIAVQNRMYPLHRLILTTQKTSRDCKPITKFRRCMMAVMFTTRVKRLTMQWQRYKKLREALKEAYYRSRAEYFAK